MQRKYNDHYCTQCNSQHCTQCKNRYYLDDDNKCTPCPKGYYCYQSNNSSIKSPCPKGSANNKIAQSVCEDCKKSSETISGTIALKEGSLSCSFCPDGYYASKSAQTTECDLCLLGYYCPGGKIIPCQKGYTNNKKGQSTCNPCLKSNSTTTGTYANSRGQSLCLACSNGSYTQNQAQTTTCNTCPQGYYCPQGKIIQCPAGTYDPQGSTNCLPCAVETTSNAGAALCFSCAQGCNSCQTSASNCLTCKAGYYRNGSSCTVCPAGYYCSGGTAGKTICPANYYCPQGSSSAKACPSGYTSNKGSTNSSACKSPFDCKGAGGTEISGYCFKKVNRDSGCPSASAGHTWSAVGTRQIGQLCESDFASSTGAVGSISCTYNYSSKASCTIVTAQCGYKCSGGYAYGCGRGHAYVLMQYPKRCSKVYASNAYQVLSDYFGNINLTYADCYMPAYSKICFTKI